MRSVYAQFNKGNPGWEEFLARAIRWSFTISNIKNKFIKKRAGWCEMCHMGGKKLVAHHVEPIKTRKDYSSWDEYIAAVFTADLQCLCPSCHSKHHNKGKKKGLSP